jgi:hypothetical protein
MICLLLLRTSASATSALRPTGAEVMEGVSVLYNNDGENLWAVTSPYHIGGTAINGTTIRGSVDDVAVRMPGWYTGAAADVNMICPFHNVPWWDSKIEPPQEHQRWYDTTFNFTWGAGGSQLDYVLKGGDFIGDFADECAKTGQKAFVTIRLNDGQMCNHPPAPDNTTSLSNNDHTFDRMSEFWWRHKNDSEVILDKTKRWEPCCWGSFYKIRQCSCSNSACELSWTSPLVRNRLINLIGEVTEMYASKGLLAGISLDFERGLDYFPTGTPQSVRSSIMPQFVKDVRLAMDKSGHELALGLRLTPRWGTLQKQGLENLTWLVTPTSAGGAGVTYFNWGINYLSFMPYESDLASLASATPTGVPFFWEVSSFTGNGPSTVAGCRPAYVRMTKEELWTTALVARWYGAQGISAFNFIYTRNFSDMLCERKENEPFSEPLFAELGRTKNETFISQHADQLYRATQFSSPVLKSGESTGSVATLLTMVPPKLADKWQKNGRLRVLLSAPLHASFEVVVKLNGQALRPCQNSSSIYPTGVQAAGAVWPQTHWKAWDVPSVLPRQGNNSVAISLQPTFDKSRSPPEVQRGPLNNTDLQPSLVYNHTYRRFKDKAAGALSCQAACDADSRCKAWSYVIGGGQWGEERCCFHGVLGCPLRKVGVVSGARTAGVCSDSSTEIKLLEVQLAMPVQALAG